MHNGHPHEAHLNNNCKCKQLNHLDYRRHWKGQI